jgi:hypothetical protein
MTVLGLSSKREVTRTSISVGRPSAPPTPPARPRPQPGQFGVSRLIPLT